MLPTLKRWFDLTLMTVVALLIWVILFPYLESAAYHFITVVDPWPSWVRFPIISLLVAIIWSVIVKLGGFRLSDILSITFVRYPPVWFFGILGTILYLLFLSNYRTELFNGFDLANPLSLVASILLGIIIASLLNMQSLKYRDKFHKHTKRDSEGANFESITSDPEKLIKWVERESPIDEPSQDLFGLNLIAKRVTRILINQKTRTIGVVGSYGSGKSSLINLVEHYLDRKSEIWRENQAEENYGVSSENIFSGKIILCRVDGWGRTKGSIAQQILSLAVKRLSLEVDCLSIVTVPAKYREALTGFKSSLATIIAALLSPEEDPIKILARIDLILKTAHIRLIIFLEDLDRNISDTMLRDEMPALLDRLHNLSNISFVLAIGTEQHYSSILIRICEHLENIS